MTTPPPWMLRRFAVRALCVLSRHERSLPLSDATLRTLPPSAEAYIIGYAHTAEARDHVRAANRRVHGSIAEIERMLAAFAAFLHGRLPGFRPQDHVDHYDDAIEALAAGQRMLVALTEARVHANSAEDAFWPALEQTLAEAMNGLEVLHRETSELTEELKAAQTRLRVLGDVLYTEVEALRLRMQALVGTRHDDYRKLGIEGAWLDDEDDDLIAAETVADDIAAIEDDLRSRRAS